MRPAIVSGMVTGEAPVSASPLVHLHNAPYLPPEFCISIAVLFSISLGAAVIPRRNEKQRLCKILGGK